MCLEEREMVIKMICTNLIYVRNFHEISYNSKIVTNTWTPIPPLKEVPVKRYGHSACVFKNKMYIIGGTSFAGHNHLSRGI